MLIAVATILSSTLVLGSITILIFVLRRNNTDNSCSEINNQYIKLLKLGFDVPELREYDSTSNYYKSKDTLYRRKYNIYAFMCWNLIETIFDHQKEQNERFKHHETWNRIMREENRLHYTWFKHNTRLFNPEFQNFVNGELNNIDIVYGDTNDLKDLYTRFERDFPQSERKELEHLEMLMNTGKYKLVLIKHRGFNEVLGYALLYVSEKTNQLWLDYIAIEENYQGFSYGTLLFNKIIDLESESTMGVFMEIENPDKNDVDYSNQVKRIRFYERLGVKKLNLNYILPTKEGGFPIGLHYKATGNHKMLPEEIIRETINDASNFIHSDIESRGSIFESFASSIKDEYFDS